MLRLADKIRQRQMGQASNEPDSATSTSIKNASIRDKLLQQDLSELKTNMPSLTALHFPDPNKLHEFEVIVSPKEGFWARGRFRFQVNVPEGYNHVPPAVKCVTKIWHPNIDEYGHVCLSILRPSSLDDSGWLPTRKLYEVIWGIESLFGDLCDFSDPLNGEAAKEYQRDPESFKRTVRNYVHQYAKN